MKLYEDLWRTMYDEDFSKNKYFYHYTSISKAIKILYSNALRFSKLNTVNDTLEWKPKISKKAFHDAYAFKSAIDYFEDIARTEIQLLCFSRDSSCKLKATSSIETKLTDYSGRGFALPRMWAQYADNNNGICLLFDKSALRELIKDSIGEMLIHDKPVRYIDKFKEINIDESEIKNLISLNERIGNDHNKLLIYSNFIKNNLEFLEYNYFTKLKDWSHENEYRFLAIGNNEYFINNIFDVLVGVVVGEKIEPTDQSIICNACSGKCEIMKINFSFDGCKLAKIYT